MTTQTLNDDIIKVINDFMNVKKSFTAYDVTVELRKSGDYKHHEVRKIVHHLFNDGQMPNYDRTDAIVQGQMVLLYHDKSVTPDPNNIGQHANATPGGTISPNPSVQLGPAVIPKSQLHIYKGRKGRPYGNGEVLPDGDGRVNVPRNLLDKLNVNYTTIMVVPVDEILKIDPNASKSLLCGILSNCNNGKKYKINSNGNIRIHPIKSGFPSKPKYKFEVVTTSSQTYIAVLEG